MVEWLNSYEDVLAWAVRAEVLAPREADALSRRAARDEAAARATAKRAVELRECVFRLFSAIAREGKPAEGDLALLNEVLQRGLTHLRVQTTSAGYGWGWDPPAEDAPDALEYPLWVVAWEAADLLVSPEVARVGICAGTPCGWLFLDRSRNRSRRWCDMKDCGNRAKVRRHYARHRPTGNAKG